MELRIVAAAVRRGAALIALLAIVLAGAGAVAVRMLDQTYRASATLLLDPTAVLVPGEDAAVGDPERYVDSQLRVLGSAALAERAAGSVTGLSAEDVRSALTLTQITGSDVVDVTAEAATPTAARDIANAVADAYVTSRDEESSAAREAQTVALDAQIAALQGRLAPAPDAASTSQQLLSDQIADLQGQRNALALPTATQDRTAVLDPATEPTSSESPSAILGALAGGLAGLLLGLMIAAFREARRPHVMGAGDTRAVLGRPPVAEFVVGRRRRDHGDGRALGASAIRPATTLAATVTGAPAAHAPRRVVVCGAGAARGSGEVATALAVALARQGARVAFVALADGDGLRDGSADAPARPGGDPAWRQDDVLGEPRLAVWRPRAEHGIPTGESVRELLKDLAGDLDVVVLHAPPVLASSLGTQTAAHADGLVLAVTPGVDHEDDLALAHQTVLGTGVAVYPVLVRPRRSPRDLVRL